MFQPNTTKNKHGRRHVAKLVHFEAFLSEESTDNFYSGFSGRIEDGGIFITTWRLVDKYTPVEVTIHFPEGQTIRPRGTVEWIREASPEINNTLPGIGISFFELKPVERDLIENWLITHPPVFLDNVSLTPLPHADVSPDDIEVEVLPINIGPGCDLNEEHLFISGLARDITHYLNERPITCLSDRISHHRSDFSDTENRVPESIWTLQVLPGPRQTRFQGAFQQEDPEHRLFVQTDAPAAIGAQLNLQLICETGVSVGCTGEVRWIRKHNPLVDHFNAPAGMGVVIRQMKSGAWHTINPHNSQMVYCKLIGWNNQSAKSNHGEN